MAMPRNRLLKIAISTLWPTMPQACEEAAISTQLRDEFLDGQVFYSLKEVRIIIESWRPHHNTKRLHSLTCPEDFGPLAT